MSLLLKLPRDRFAYSPIRGRSGWRLPGGARVAVWTIVNVEDWDITKPMARTVLPAPQGVVTVPDVPNWAWHEYGMRVGFWRLAEALAKRKIRATTAINAGVCRSYEPVARAMLELGWEFMGHGVVQAAVHTLPDQRAAIRTAIQILRDFTGRTPKGWLGPGLAETWDTLDLLAEAGIEYVADWVNDDQPYELRTKAGVLVSVPYTLELGDLPVLVGQHHTEAAWLARLRDQFDRLYAEGARQPRVLALGLHPYISGVPHRIKYVEAFYDYVQRRKGVWLAAGEEIYEWYKTGPTTPGETSGTKGRVIR